VMVFFNIHLLDRELNNASTNMILSVKLKVPNGEDIDICSVCIDIKALEQGAQLFATYFKFLTYYPPRQNAVVFFI
jgi:hypothetical protein